MAKRKSRCQRCGRRDDVCGPISKRGNCMDCASTLAIEASLSMHNKEGAVYDKYRANLMRAMSEGRVGRPETPYEPGV